MSRVDELPPDQRAALSVLLRQHKSYEDVADMLGIDEHAVHDRAHAALAVLAPRLAREVEASRRAEIGDYLLGQQPAVAERMRTRTLLSSSEPAAAWARALIAELAPLANGSMPDIPESLESAVHAVEEERRPAPYPLREASSAAPAGAPAAPSSSRLGGALVLAAIAAAVIVVLILVLSGGGGSSHHHASTTSSTGTSTTTASQEGQIKLVPPEAHSGSRGTVEVLSEGSKRAFYIQAEKLPITTDFYYAIWLYNSPTSALPLSKAPAVGKSHKLAGAALLPSNAGEYHEIVVTRETNTRPRHPGHIVLHGPLTLSG